MLAQLVIKSIYLHMEPGSIPDILYTSVAQCGKSLDINNFQEISVRFRSEVSVSNLSVI